MAKKLDGKLFLYKVTKEGDFTIFGWNPILAKKGYKVITKEEAVPLQKLLGIGKGHLKYIENKKLLEFLDTARVEGEPLPEDDDDDMNNEVIADVIDNAKENAPPGDRPLDETRELMVTQEDIEAQELKYIKGMTHKSTLEKHMLEKYQCEIPVGRLTAMKAIANSMIADLSDDNRLYLVGDELTLT
jgi:hypothetical protein